MPDHQSGRYYKSVIDHLASANDSVSFEPHVTISRLPEGSHITSLIDAVQMIGKKLNRFQVHLSEAVYGELPYQKITLPLLYTPELFHAFDVIDSVLDGEFSKRSFPHLSLFYGYQQAEELQDILSSLNKKPFPDTELSALALYKLNGSPDSWKMVYKTDLS